MLWAAKSLGITPTKFESVLSPSRDRVSRYRFVVPNITNK